MSSNDQIQPHLPKNSVIPPYFLKRGLDHFSPTQATTPLDVWIYKYLHCNQEKRRRMKISSKMRCGVLVGDSVAADISGKVRPLFFYDDYKNWDDTKDKAQWENDKEHINSTIEQIFKAFNDEELKFDWKNTKTVFEYYVNYQDQRLEVPIIGRTDIQSPKILIELKTKWSNAVKRKLKNTEWTEDIGWNYNFPKLKEHPEDSHLQQASFYYKATKIPTFIVQAHTKDYKIYNVTDYDYEKAFDELVINCVKKQECAKLDNPENYIQPDFSSFYWRVGDQFFKEAKELYGY